MLLILFSFLFIITSGDYGKYKASGELHDSKRVKHSHSPSSPKTSRQPQTEFEDGEKRDEEKKATEDTGPIDNVIETIQPKVEETSDEREVETKPEKTEVDEVKERIARDREKVMRICESLVKDANKEGEENIKREDESATYRGMSGLLPLPTIPPRVIFPPRIISHHPFPIPRPYSFISPPFIPPNSFPPPSINPSLLYPKLQHPAADNHFKFHPPHYRPYNPLHPEFSPLLPPGLEPTSSSFPATHEKEGQFNANKTVFHAFPNRPNRAPSTSIPQHPAVTPPTLSSSLSTPEPSASSGVSPRTELQYPLYPNTPPQSPMALDSPTESSSRVDNSCPYLNSNSIYPQQHTAIFYSPNSNCSTLSTPTNTSTIDFNNSYSLSPSRDQRPSHDEQHVQLSPHSQSHSSSLSPAKSPSSSPSSPNPLFLFPHGSSSLSSSPIPPSLNMSPLPAGVPSPNSTEEPGSYLEQRIQRILKAQEERHAAAYCRLAHQMEGIGKKDTNDTEEDSKKVEEKEELVKGNSLAIETAAVFTKFRSNKQDLVDISSFKANSSLFSYLKVS